MKKLLTNTPLVSVIMPVYNAGAYLVPAIESILKQSYQNFEFIIVNDASTDDSGKILEGYKKRFPKKIRLVTLTKNRNAGGDACANLAIKYAKGKYIARMDADDISHKTRLFKQVAFLESHAAVFLVGSNATVIDAQGKVIGVKDEPLTNKNIYKSYFTFHPLIHPSVMVRRVSASEKFSYQIKYSANNDYYTFFTLLCEGKQFANLKDKLLYYRIHGKNDTFVHMKTKFMNTLRIRLTMSLKHGYKPALSAILTTFIQATIVFLLPEKMLAQLYFLSKGIKTISFPKFSLGKIIRRPLFFLPRVVANNA